MTWPLSLRHVFRLARLLLIIVSATPTLHADVWVVAKSDDADFDEVSDAVAWAAEGDTIWIRNGEYGPVEINAKSVHLAAFRESAIVIAGIDVMDLQAGQVVSLSGIQVVDPNPSSDGALSISDCTGSVRARDCRFGTYEGGPRCGPGLHVLDSTDVALVRCRLRAGVEAIVPRRGLLARNSSISLHDCELKGGTGLGDSGKWDGTAGIELEDCALWLSGSEVEGGGGWNPDWCTWPGNGGAGLIAHGVSFLYLQESSLSGGEGGEGYGLFCEIWGDYGPDTILGPDVTVVEIAEPSRSWRCDNMSYDGDTVRITYDGEPGDEVYIARATRGAFRISPSLGGTQLIARPTTRPPFLGDASNGRLVVELPIAQLLPPDPQETFLLQIYVVDADGEFRWADPGQLSVIDSALIAPYLEPVYVDIDAPDGGDGSSWDLAYNDLQLAFDELYEHWDQEFRFPRIIWIAEGVYITPWTSTGKSFLFKFPGFIYGGFAGDEVDLDQRNWQAHPTILSGDVLGDDLPGFQNREDNADRVLSVWAWGAGTVEIDGLTIRGGGGSDERDGAGVYVGAVDWILARNCSFLDNRGEQGGAVYLAHEYTLYDRSAHFVNCVFQGNVATGYGGAISHRYWHTTLLRCTFTGNRSVGGSGGALAGGTGHHEVNRYTDCEFSRNRAQEGGAIFSYVYETATAIITSCTIRDNEASNDGGGIACTGGSPLLANTILWNNVSNGQVTQDTQLTVTGSALLPLHHCCIHGWTGAWGGVGNHGLDPLFVNGGRLGPGSPCVDAADNTVVPLDDFDLDGDGITDELLPLDLDGQPRFVDDPNVPDTGVGPPPVVDMGAYERQVP